MARVIWDPDELRTAFTLALSEMYRKEVPLYGTLVEIVHKVDDWTLATQGREQKSLPARHELERHGAIRLGTAHEMRTIKQFFAILGMHPVGYYDLGVVGFPLHATAFRPTAEEALAKNPFRVFTTLLRRERISPSMRPKVGDILQRRNLFTPRLLDIIDRAEAGQSMTSEDANNLISDALLIFKWHSRSTVPISDYLNLKDEHPMIADIACFPSAHINHLTPRTLDIDLVQQEMIGQGLPAKEQIEGPPRRQCPILLRQTSFKALGESVEFEDQAGRSVSGIHTARFGEVEQRGAAVTPEGRKLYDHLLGSVRSKGSSKKVDDALSDTFSSYPDTWQELRAQKLVYFRYLVTPTGRSYASDKSLKHPDQIGLDQLISLGLVEYEPITYEDFLPFSAAGIFQSNLGNGSAEAMPQDSDNGLSELEGILGCKILNEFELYSNEQEKSIRACQKALGLSEILIQ